MAPSDRESSFRMTSTLLESILYGAIYAHGVFGLVHFLSFGSGSQDQEKDARLTNRFVSTRPGYALPAAPDNGGGEMLGAKIRWRLKYTVLFNKARNLLAPQSHWFLDLYRGHAS